MDFMKVIDQTVRDIKREVNLKVLKVPEIEQKVLDATSDEPWGPHGSDLAELAQATKRYTECQMIMGVLWQRLSSTDANWRHTYKALAVIEYLLANGSERAVDEIQDGSSRISKLSRFQCVESNGKDVGINVRKKVETILGVLDDKEKLQEVREKAASTRDKFIGLSSSAMSYKSSSSSISRDSYSSADHYGSFNSSREADYFKDSYKDSEYDHKDRKSRNSAVSKHTVKKNVPKGSSNGRSYDSSQSTGVNVLGTKTQTGEAEPINTEDDYDDFDPRGPVGRKGSNQVDFLGPNLIDDLMDAPVPSSAGGTTASAVALDADLFADSSFESAVPQSKGIADSHVQINVDLFAGQPTGISLESHADFNVRENPKKASEEAPSIAAPANTNAFDPFASIPLNNFTGSEATRSNVQSTTWEPTKPPAGGFSGSGQSSDDITFGEFTAHQDLPSKGPVTAKNLPNKKDTFQVKSGIWADSLSRGLIDLNISAPKKVDLTSIGIVGGLGDVAEEERGPPASTHNMGRAMGSGIGIGKPGLSSSTTSSATQGFSYDHFGSFK